MRLPSLPPLSILALALAATAQEPVRPGTPPPTATAEQAQAAKAEEPQPWRLGTALELPDWLRISGSVRLRYEALDGQFRNSPQLSDNDGYFVSRTLLQIEADFDRFTATVEGIDSRQETADSGSFIDTTIVNTFDILQANLNTRLGKLGDGEHSVMVGRFTMDRGMRRLVARNDFRNTINAFDGIGWSWRSSGKSWFNAFWTMPVLRLPSSRNDLLDNRTELDEQDKDQQFYGGFYETPLDDRTKLELYTFAIDDRRVVLREHFTPGFRVVRSPLTATFDYEVEAALQLGESAPSGTTPSSELDHRAWFGHVQAGYTFDADWRPRVQLAWDYASGDKDPTDDENNRFDTLFGARRWEYGPTGIYGSILRSNLNSPELRLTLQPTRKIGFMTALRGIWLAEAKDAWVPANLRDPTGNSGKHVGDQIEARLRFEMLPKSLQFEVGGAYLFADSFQERAPGGRGQDTIYGYVQMHWFF